MQELVSRRTRRLFRSLRSWTRSALPDTFLPVPLFAQAADVVVHFLGGVAVKAGKAACVVLHPVFWAWAQDKPAAVLAYREAIPRSEAELAEQVGRQGYLVLAAYRAHGFVLSRRNTVQGR